MKPPDEIKCELVQQWMAKAEEDFHLVEHLSAVADDCYFNAIGFHAQQSAEKFLKALLVHHQIEFPKTHDIDELLDLIENIDPSLAESLDESSALSPYSVDARYPGDFPQLTPVDAKKALRLATHVREMTLKSLAKYS